MRKGETSPGMRAPLVKPELFGKLVRDLRDSLLYFTVSYLRIPQHGVPGPRIYKAQAEVKVQVIRIFRPLISRPVCLRIRHQSDAHDQIVITL
jgi:hypothetical protein